MAVTVQSDDAFNTDADDLDGHTLEELADYLDAGRDPFDESIERSTACQHALAALSRLRSVTEQVLAAPSPSEPDDQQWVTAMMARIATDARAGRDITLEHGLVGPRVVMTEGAVKALIRATGDGIASMLVGRVDVGGDLTSVEAPITMTVGITVLYGADIVATATAFRAAVVAALQQHAALPSVVLDVTVQDLQAPTRAGAR